VILYIACTRPDLSITLESVLYLWILSTNCHFSSESRRYFQLVAALVRISLILNSTLRLHATSSSCQLHKPLGTGYISSDEARKRLSKCAKESHNWAKGLFYVCILSKNDPMIWIIPSSYLNLSHHNAIPIVIVTSQLTISGAMHIS
jgi:cellulose synthase/poly-beta-1,6-N-acetylglucosamine synthase-like glycosyltransferase